MKAVETEMVRQRTAEMAYRLWERDGRPDGKDVEHWLEAERLLSSPPMVQIKLLVED